MVTAVMKLRHLLLGRKAMTNLDIILKGKLFFFFFKENSFANKVHLLKAVVFPVVMYGCESWTIKQTGSEESMLLNCGLGEDSRESLVLQGDQTSQF